MPRCESPSPRARRARAGRARAVVCAVLVVAACGVAATRARAEVPTGAIYVTTLPSGAEVWIDGVYIGRSPVLADGLARGRHAITITKSGWNPRQVSLDVVAGGIAMSSTALDAGPASVPGGSILLRALPDGAHVAIDGHAVDDPTRPQNLPAGIHRISVEGSHGARSSRTIVVVPETASVVVLRDPEPATARSKVVALADDYVPGASVIEGAKVVVRYGGHVVVGKLGDPSLRFDGATVAYDVPPETIGGKLYLPLELLERLTGGRADAHATVRPRATSAPSATPAAPASGPTLTPSAAPLSAPATSVPSTASPSPSAQQ